MSQTTFVGSGGLPLQRPTCLKPVLLATGAVCSSVGPAVDSLIQGPGSQAVRQVGEQPQHDDQTSSCMLAGADWSPAGAGRRHVALWRAQVLDYQVLGRPRGWNAGSSPALPNFAGPVLRLLVGDSSGARTELLVPHRPE